MRERSSPTGRLTIRLIDPRTGAIEHEQRVDNLVTLAGRRILGDLLRGAVDLRTSGSIRIAAGWSDPLSEPSLAQTALTQQRIEAEAISGEPVVRVIGNESRVVTTFMATFDADFSSQDIELNEAGIRLVPDGQAPVLYNRVVFGTITKSPALQMTLSWEVIF